MGIAPDFPRAFGKAMLASGMRLPKKGRAFISVKHDDKPAACIAARKLHALGFELVATSGTCEALLRAGLPATPIHKVREGSPHAVDALRAGTIDMVVNTTVGAREIRDSYSIRRAALLANVPYFTTIAAALAAADALTASAREGGAPSVKSVQEWHAREPLA